MLNQNIESILENSDLDLDIEIIKASVYDVRQGPKPMVIYNIWLVNLDDKEYIKTKLFVELSDMSAEFAHTPDEIFYSYDDLEKTF